MSQSDDLQTRAALEAIGALSKRLTTIEAQTRADAVHHKPDDDARRHDTPVTEDDLRKTIAGMQRQINMIAQHLASGQVEEGEGSEADDDDSSGRKDLFDLSLFSRTQTMDDDDAHPRHARRARRRDDDDDKEMPARTAADDDDDDKVHTAQHRHDSVLQLHGARADRPRVLEGSAPYRQRLCKQSQRLLPEAHPMRRADFSLIRDPVAFDQIEAQLLEALKSAAYDPAHNVSQGQLREVVEIDRAGRRISRWVGDVGVTLAPFKSPTQRAKINRPVGNVYNNQ